jgi:cytochrome P450
MHTIVMAEMMKTLILGGSVIQQTLFQHWSLVVASFCAAATLWWWDAPLRFLIFFKRSILRDKHSPRFPPGGMGMPFLGELPFILVMKHPDKLGAYRKAKYKLGTGIVCGSTPPLTRVITLNSYDAVKWGLSMDHRGLEGCLPKGTQTLLGKNSVSVLTGKAHSRVRSALIPVFRPQHLCHYVSRVNEIVRHYLLKEWTPAKGSLTKRICIRDEMKALTFTIIADLVLGLDLEKDRETIHELKELFIVLFDGLFMPTIPVFGTKFMAALKARKRIKEILLPVIQQQREAEVQNEQKDIIDIMLAPTKDDDGNEMYLSNDEILDILVNLLFAGSDTSTCSMTWVLKFLNTNPSVFERLRQEHLALRSERSNLRAETNFEWDDMESLRYTNQVIFEALRVHPPVAGGFRKATKDLVYRGYLIPKGYTVAFDFQSMTGDPKYHESSTVFNPDRFKSDTALGGLSHSGYIPFGGGARMCIGYRLAIAEMNVFIIT